MFVTAHPFKIFAFVIAVLMAVITGFVAFMLARSDGSSIPRAVGTGCGAATAALGVEVTALAYLA